MDFERQTVEFEGCGLSWFARGPAAAPVVLFIHGTGVGGRAWEPQVEALSSEFRCVCFDNRGFGGSQPAPRSVTVEQMARDSLGVLDASGAATAHVVGHSLGGLVALQVALLARARCLSLSLLNTFADGGIPTGLSLRMLWFGTRTMVGEYYGVQRPSAFQTLPPWPPAITSRNPCFVPLRDFPRSSGGFQWICCRLNPSITATCAFGGRRPKRPSSLASPVPSSPCASSTP